MVFNPSTDFRGKVELILGLKYPAPDVFRKALQYHVVQEGYDFYFLHNGKNRMTSYCKNRMTACCKNRCECEWKKGRFGEATVYLRGSAGLWFMPRN